MLRDTWFWEIEVVRLEDGEQSGPARWVNFSLRPLTGLLAALLAGEVALLGIMPLDPEEYGGYDRFHGCGCGAVYDPEGVYRPPPPPTSDSTLLVRRLP